MNTISKDARSACRVVSVLLALIIMSGLLVIPSKTEAAAKIKLSETSLTLTAKEKKTLKLKKGKKTVKNGVKWSSTKKKVAKVSSKGKITALKKGKTKIVAKYKGKKYICKLTVKKADKGQTDPTVTPAPVATETPSATVTPAPGTTVTPSVTVTPAPTATQAAEPTKAPEATVTAAPTATPVPSVVLTIESAKDEVAALDSLALTLKADGKKVTDGVKWTTEDKNIATVSSSGRVTGAKKGSVTITAEYKGVTADKEIKILDTAIKVKDSALKITDGGFGIISFTENGKDVFVDSATFKSSNEKIVKVYPDGTVVGESVGKADVTVSYAGKTSYVSVTVEKYTSNISKIEGSLTPQMFGAKGDGKTDDTKAFRDMFTASVENSSGNGWKHCQAIYIPSGTYVISGTVFDDKIKPSNGKPLTYCMFEITGSGRESTTIKFTGDVMFEARTSGDHPIFGFTTFKDIGFLGNNKNTFMTMTVTGGDGTQRMQFLSCGFGSFNSILYCIKSNNMLSEITFSYCKIANCGNDSDRCKLFVLNNPQAVNWRFDYTDIESFNGDAFVWKTGTAVEIRGGSIIPGNNGCAFNFDIENQGGLGGGNAPQLMVNGARFEIHPGQSLLKTNSNSSSYPKVVFRDTNVNSSAALLEDGTYYVSYDWMVIKGGLDATFDNCYKCSFARFNVDCSGYNAYIKPRIKFLNCPGMDVEGLADLSTKVVTVNGGLAKNNLRITVDNTYDFYLTGDGDRYYHTVSDLQECRQTVKISGGDYDYDTTSISDGKTIKAKPYGYVDYVEITVPKNETWKAYPVTVALYNGSTKISDTVKIDFSSGNTYIVKVNEGQNYVGELSIKFGNQNSQNPNVNMNITIVKK
ncbi:MAG: Ig-like domain-containing protein [Clostridiales bacterium]|nr:Ig-like domain-containing protein [Clostridiales bacterium]